MADSEINQSPATATATFEGDEKNSGGKLKHLDFVQTAAIYIVVSSGLLYDYAKRNSGPLRAGVQAVEGSVKAAVGPVYQKFRDVPLELLKFVDRKVDDSMNEIDRHVPPLLKTASHNLLVAAHKAPEVLHNVASEVKRAGVVDAAASIGKSVYAKCEPRATQAYVKYEPLTEQYAVSAWQSMNRLPLFPQLAQIFVPTAAHWCEKYNEAVKRAAGKGYAASFYLPVVPIKRIENVFNGAGDESSTSVSVSTNAEAVAASS